MARKKRYNTKRKSSTKITREDDASHRVTFLLSASHILHTASPSLSRFYNGTVKQIGRRINLSLDAVSVKRLICKRCNTLLVSGNCRQRLAPRRQSHVVVTCNHCGIMRRYVNRKRGQQQDKLPEVNVESFTTRPEELSNSTPTEQTRKRRQIGDMCTMV